jgi:salicylate 5-hydroxylase large subunit
MQALATDDHHWPNEGISRVPGWVYSAPDVFAREQERIFKGRSWCYVCLEAEIPNAGDFRRSYIGGKVVLAVRRKDGGVSVVLNRCAHRGAEFCSAKRGNKQEFVCPYHEWTYDLEGNLIGVPFRRGYQKQGGMPADFKPEENGLVKLEVASRHGVVFASFDHDIESFEDYLGEKMLGYFDRVFDGRKLTILGYERQRIPANWKLMMENIKDPYHASLLHVFLVSFGLFRMDQKSQVQMDPTGRHCVLVNRKGEQSANVATSEMRNFKADFKLNDPRLLDPVREFPGDATVVMQTLWPNLIIQQQSNTLAVRQVVPIDEGHHDLAWTFFGYENDDAAMRQRRLRQANLMGPAGFVSIDDSEAMMISQTGIAASPEKPLLVEMGGREVDDAEHTITEVAIRGFYQHYREVMGY